MAADQRLSALGQALGGTLDRLDGMLAQLPDGSDPDTYRPNIPATYLRLHKGVGRSPDVVLRPLAVPACAGTVLIAYVEGLVDLKSVDGEVVAPLMTTRRPPSTWGRAVLPLGTVRALRTWDEILGDLLSGHTLVFAPGSAVAWSAPTADPPARSIDRPVTEAVSRGPDEAFTEALGTQIGQVRRYLGTPALQVRTLGVGDAFGKVAVVYLESLANPALVDTVLGRLGRVTGRLRPTATAIAGAIRDHPRSIFPTVRSTERVGFVIGALAQGKVAILVDGDPFALLVPAPLADFYRTEQDDTGAWPDASFVRVIRFVGWAMGVYLPALFVAVTQVNPNVIPMSLLITFAGSRAGLPATPLAEVVVMILILETLREAAFRLPKVLGTTIGTVGAIVVGTSVVSAGIVSPQVIVVITLTALSFFTAPVYELTGTWRLVNLAMLLTAAYLGVVGIVLTTMLVLSEITSMTSFGVPYFAPWAPLRLREWADTLLRLPWQSLRWRPADPRPLDRTLPPLPRRGVPDLRPNPR